MHQIRIACMEGTERRSEKWKIKREEAVRNCKGKGTLDTNSQQAVIKPGKILLLSFLMKRKIVQEQEEDQEEGEIEG